jgi:outer membrane lipoprotein-sorting protein
MGLAGRIADLPAQRACVPGVVAFILLVGGIVSGCGGNAPSSAPAPPARSRSMAWRQPEALAILDQMRDAIQRTRTLTAAIVATSRPVKGPLTQIAGTVALKRPNLERLQLKTGDLTVSDGKALYRYSDQTRSYIKSDPGANGAAIGEERFEPVSIFWRAVNVAPDIPGAFLKYAGVEKRGGARFDLIEYRLSLTTIRYFVSPMDHLLHRVERRATTPNGTALQASEMTHVRTNVPLDDRLFRWTPPTGARLVATGGAGASAPKGQGSGR